MQINYPPLPGPPGADGPAGSPDTPNQVASKLGDADDLVAVANVRDALSLLTKTEVIALLEELNTVDGGWLGEVPITDIEYNDGSLEIATGIFTHKPGTLHHAATVPVLTDLAANPGRTKPIFTSQDHVTPAYVRSSNHLLPSADLTCISPWNSEAGPLQTCVAVTPRYCLAPNHYYPPDGSTIRFVADDNTVVTRTIVDVIPLGDVVVIELDSDLPASITPAVVMPADWVDYLGENGGTQICCFATDQEEKLLVNFIETVGPLTSLMGIRRYTTGPFAAFGEAFIGGDSANPIFPIVNDQVVLLAGLTNSNLEDLGQGPPYYKHLDAIEAITGPLTKLDMSGFENYA